MFGVIYATNQLTKMMWRKACLPMQKRCVTCSVVPQQPKTNSIYLVKRQSNPLSYTEHYPDHMRHYVIGFPNTSLARQVMYNMAPDPSIRLYRRNHVNVTEEVNEGLDSLGCEKVDGAIILDTQAMLHIPRQDSSLPPEMNDGMFHLSKISFEDFLMYPFNNNIGIIMPYYVDRDTPHELVMLSNVIESTNSTKGFRHRFSK